MQTSGEGVKESENFADFINGCSLSRETLVRSCRGKRQPAFVYEADPNI